MSLFKSISDFISLHFLNQRYNADIIVISNDYPKDGDLYRNQFVHARVKAYIQEGLKVQVFCYKKNKTPARYIYDGVSVVVGPSNVLLRTIKNNNFKSIVIHFMNEEIWKTVNNFHETPKIIWVHGAEIQPWHRREFNLKTPLDREMAIKKSHKRELFWKNFLPTRENVHFVFVSQYFYQEVTEDYKVTPVHYSVIHNPVNTQLFKFELKHEESRFKILSIRSYASPKYGNDLTIKCINYINLKYKNPRLSFTLVGDGELFEHETSQLESMKNITLERRFLEPKEMSTYFKNHGILLIPTRWDSQGVTMGEGMCAGMVVISNSVAAIPEFTDQNCSILSPSEDYIHMAEGVISLLENPKLFLEMSKNGSQRMQQQCGIESINHQEVKLICSKMTK